MVILKKFKTPFPAKQSANGVFLCRQLHVQKTNCSEKPPVSGSSFPADKQPEQTPDAPGRTHADHTHGHTRSHTPFLLTPAGQQKAHRNEHRTQQRPPRPIRHTEQNEHCAQRHQHKPQRPEPSAAPGRIAPAADTGTIFLRIHTKTPSAHHMLCAKGVF